MADNPAGRAETNGGGDIRALINLNRIYSRIGNDLPWILEGVDLKKLDVGEGVSSQSLQNLALISIFQFAEGLNDFEAAETLRTRLDWKLALQSSFAIRAIQPQELCNFRRTLLRHPAAMEVMDQLVYRIIPYGLFGARPQAGGLTSRLAGKACNGSRIYQVEHAFIRSLGALAACDHQWLKENTCPHWYARYGDPGSRMKSLRNESDIRIYAQRLGEDAHQLIKMAHASSNPLVASLPEIKELEKVMTRHYKTEGDIIEWRITCQDGEEYAIYLNNQTDAMKL